MSAETRAGVIASTALQTPISWPVLCGRVSIHLVIFIVVVIWMEPTIALLVSSFRPANQVATTGWWTAFQAPFQFTSTSINRRLAPQGWGRAFVNSLFIAIPATVLPIMVAAFAAFAFAWMDFPGRDLLFVIVVGLLVVPLKSTLIPFKNLQPLSSHRHFPGHLVGAHRLWPAFCRAPGRGRAPGFAILEAVLWKRPFRSRARLYEAAASFPQQTASCLIAWRRYASIVSRSISTLFLDIGGVLLTNGWDHTMRQKAAESFDLDYRGNERTPPPDV